MADPLYPNRPQATTRYGNKYAPGSDDARFVNSLDPVVSRAMKRLDAQRANVGQNPLTSTQTRQAGRAANENRAVTPEPKTGWFDNITSDIADIATAIPHLPVTMFREVDALRDFPQAVENMPVAANPLEQVGNVAQLPGVRFVPGSFIAGQFGTGGPGLSGALEHPVISTLDVLPYFSKAAKLSKTVKVAEDLAETSRPIQALSGSPTRTPAVSTFVRNWRPSGPRIETVSRFNQPVEQLVPNPVGRALNTLKSNLTGNRNAITAATGTMWGEMPRAVSRAYQRIGYDAAQGDLRGYPGVDDLPGVGVANKMVDDMLDLTERYTDDIPEDRQAVIFESAVRGEGMPDLTPTEREFALAADAVQRPMTDHLVRTGQIARENVGGYTEIFDVRAGQQIAARRYLEGQQAGVQKLRNHLDPTSEFRMTPDELVTDFRTMLTDDNLSPRMREDLSSGYISALDDAGIDTAKLRTTFRKTKRNDLQGFEVPDATTLPRQAVPADRATVTSVIDELKSAPKTDLVSRDLLKALRGKNPDFAEARAALRKLESRKKFPTTVNVEALRTELTRQQMVGKSLARIERAGVGKKGAVTFSDTLADKARARRFDTEARSVPARFEEAVRVSLDERLLAEKYGLLENAGRLDDAAATTFDEAVAGRNYVALQELGVPMQQLRAEARRSWQDLRAQGIDPIFMHSVSPSRARSLTKYPTVLDYNPSLSQVKARLWDPGPQVNNISVAIQARGMEYLMKQGSQAFVDDILRHYSRSGDDLAREFQQAAEARFRNDPSRTIEAHRQDLVSRDWAPFDPNSFINGSGAGRVSSTKFYIPRSVSKTINSFKPEPSDLMYAASKPMKLFRTSVLPLSPRWHVYNILGGAVMMFARADNPATILRFMKSAYRMTKEGGVETMVKSLDDADVVAAARMAPPGGASGRAARMAKENLFDDIVPAKTAAERAARTHNYAVGGTLRRLWDSASTKKVLRDPFNNVVQKSYDANMWFDDFYRSMAYLEGEAGGAAKGLSRAKQVARGIEAARGVLQNWDTITPMERTVLRMVFPFYGWTRHLMRYVLTYPADHPWRMSIMANIGNAEATDANSGLPGRLRGLLYYGDTDIDGNVNALNLDGANPFRDVANWASLLGFVTGQGGDASAVTSQLTPLLSVPLQLMGVDTRNGSADLYPTLRYNTRTGSLEAAPNESPLMLLAGSLLPQARGLAQLTGLSREYQDMMRTNPDAARRLLQSSFGFPVSHREVNVPQETMKAELVRMQAQKDMVNEARKSGDWGAVTAAYPNLAPFARRNMILAGSKAGAPYRAVEGVPGNETTGWSDTLRAVRPF